MGRGSCNDDGNKRVATAGWWVSFAADVTSTASSLHRYGRHTIMQ